MSFGSALITKMRRYMMVEAICFAILVASPSHSLPIETIPSNSPSPVLVIMRKSGFPEDGIIISLGIERSYMLVGTKLPFLSSTLTDVTVLRSMIPDSPMHDTHSAMARWVIQICLYFLTEQICTTF